jgi:hypothetical protein
MMEIEIVEGASFGVVDPALGGYSISSKKSGLVVLAPPCRILYINSEAHRLFAQGSLASPLSFFCLQTLEILCRHYRLRHLSSFELHGEIEAPGLCMRLRGVGLPYLERLQQSRVCVLIDEQKQKYISFHETIHMERDHGRSAHPA